MRVWTELISPELGAEQYPGGTQRYHVRSGMELTVSLIGSHSHQIVAPAESGGGSRSLCVSVLV